MKIERFDNNRIRLTSETTTDVHDLGKLSGILNSPAIVFQNECSLECRIDELVRAAITQ